ncbi:LLM class flavin-dependent oxidoreductase [Bordetella genomosp. 12]|uniref:N5,N10-methylene tetrahydromethanopterin reductase n=1 Tax=Bordetella genomosp. 12 TaxID=463035 RepID=A0A261VEI6_9BORD|nr:LLM class flavin-dependent oxidoreductase [Bordetella genomosp. 12]OZI71962.1 N5,N10-methylene tetrahydromethanopterin reductase [Bordetella genomosp. 12]
MSKHIRLNAFHMNAPSHSWAGFWRHPRDRSVDHNRLDYWVDLAVTAERGLFDGVFLADVFGIYDVYGGDAATTLREGSQSPSHDPILTVPAMAHATTHIGFGVTANLTYEHPYQFARRFSTLDHLTQGRAGWNVVTGYLDSAARGMGLDKAREHDERYAAGEDFLEAAYKLWEGSWSGSAVIRDRSPRGAYIDPAQVRKIVHEGPYYRVNGFNLAEPSPQRTPLLYQAGASGRGKAFAGTHAECVFLEGQTPAIVAQAARDIRQHAVDAGRRADDVLLYLGATVLVAATSAEARALQEEYARYVGPVGQLALVSGWTGIDFSKLDPDEPLQFVKSNALQSTVENLTKRAGRAITPRDMARFDQIGGRGPFIVGSPVEVADQLIEWVDQTGVDGFNLRRLVVPESLTAFVDLVVPELQSRGRYATQYCPGTLREKLFPGRGPHLPASHPGARYRYA